MNIIYYKKNVYISIIYDKMSKFRVYLGFRVFRVLCRVWGLGFGFF